MRTSRIWRICGAHAFPTALLSEATFTIAPPPGWAAITLAAAWQVKNTDFRLSSCTASQSASLTASAGPRTVPPALLTRTSSRPKRSCARVTTPQHCATSVRSPHTAEPEPDHPPAGVLTGQPRQRAGLQGTFVADVIHAVPPPTASRSASPNTEVRAALPCSCSPAIPTTAPFP